ncbi:MAG: hypothetical protein U0792_04565 [Gemmataceae bacterium]
MKSLLLEAEGSLGERVSDAGRFAQLCLSSQATGFDRDTRRPQRSGIRLIARAAHLRTAGAGWRGQRLANELFGRDNPWPGPVVRDAGFAARNRKDRPKPPAARTAHAVKLADGTAAIGSCSRHPISWSRRRTPSCCGG